MTDPAFIARSIQTVLERARINVSTEAAAQRDIAAALTAGGIVFEREVSLSPKDRVDFLAEGIGIEVKISGQSRRDIWAQLNRYAAHDRIEALVLAMGGAWPGETKLDGGKRLFVVNLHKGWIG